MQELLDNIIKEEKQVAEKLVELKNQKLLLKYKIADYIRSNRSFSTTNDLVVARAYEANTRMYLSMENLVEKRRNDLVND